MSRDMQVLQVLFGFAGRIGRPAFAIGLVTVLVAFVLGIQGSLAALPWMAEILAPQGINAGFALNSAWCLLGLLLIWSLLALGGKRLRDRGHSPWWAAAAVLPTAVVALLNDAIFLVSRAVTLPSASSWIVLGSAGAIGVWVLYEGLFLPSRTA